MEINFNRMKIRIFYLLLLLLSGCQTSKDQDETMLSTHQLDSLIMDNNFFKARDIFEKRSSGLEQYDKLRYQAYIDNAFNQLEASNGAIATLFAEFSEKLSDSLKARLSELRLGNNIKLQEYRQAYQVSELLVNEFAADFSEEELASIKNSALILEGLIDQPKQKVSMGGKQVIALSRDKAGLKNLTITSGGDSVGFIFDTGANISTVTQSTARKLGMNMLDASFKVRAISGIQVTSGLAVAPAFKIGDILLENTVFLVFPDSALAFPQIDYQINGIIGYPVMAALKEVQLTKSGEMIIPTVASGHATQNMAMHFLTPLLQLVSGTDTLVFTFDTGADGTTLYEDYFRKYQKEIESKYTLTNTSLGGAGGKTELDGYYIELPLTIDSKEIVLDSVQLITKNVQGQNDVYGNIGQDLISKFDTLVINFEQMFIDFR